MSTLTRLMFKSVRRLIFENLNARADLIYYNWSLSFNVRHINQYKNCSLCSRRDKREDCSYCTRMNVEISTLYSFNLFRFSTYSRSDARRRSSFSFAAIQLRNQMKLLLFFFDDNEFHQINRVPVQRPSTSYNFRK